MSQTTGTDYVKYPGAWNRPRLWCDQQPIVRDALGDTFNIIGDHRCVEALLQISEELWNLCGNHWFTLLRPEPPDV
jgi:hypothetical protein